MDLPKVLTVGQEFRAELKVLTIRAIVIRNFHSEEHRETVITYVIQKIHEQTREIKFQCCNLPVKDFLNDLKEFLEAEEAAEAEEILDTLNSERLPAE